jgi:hypothetical protein
MLVLADELEATAAFHCDALGLSSPTRTASGSS